MANRYLNQFQTSQRKGLVLEAGTISLSAAAAVSTSDFTSLVSSVTKSATGEYTITLVDKWVGLVSVQCSIETAEASIQPRIKSADPVTAKTIVIETQDVATGTVQDVTAVAKLHINILLKNSSVR